MVPSAAVPRSALCHPFGTLQPTLSGVIPTCPHCTAHPTGTQPLLAPAPSPLRASNGHGHLLSLRGCRRARARAWGQRESGGTGAAPTTRDGGNGARAELWMWVFNYTIKCTIRYNYQCSEAATVHNRHVIYCSHCLYCSALLPNDYGKLSHLHGCHGNWVRG